MVRQRIDPQFIVNVLALAGAVAVVAQLVPWGLVFSPATPTGGDTPSHFAAFVYFKDHVLPKGRLWGWDPGGLAGFPLFQFYFPGPFLLLSALSGLLGPAAAFKLGTLLPALALPLSSFWGLRLLGARFPGPALGAIFSLSFVLNETNQVWGGNLPSILAGEFCQAFAMNLIPIHLGLLPGFLDGRRRLMGPVILLVLIGYCHAYGLLFTLLAGLYFVFQPGRFRRRAGRFVLVYGLAFCLLAPWTIPMLAYLPETELFNFVWAVDSWKEYLPPNLWPVAALALLGGAFIWRRGDPEDRRRAGYLVFWILVAVGLYLAAPLMNTVTIRFLPFGHLAVTLLAGLGAGAILSADKLRAGRNLLVLALILAGAVWAGARVGYLPHWLVWNNAGLERSAAWPDLKRLFDRLRPPAGASPWASARVAYEHSTLNERGGSVRVFESLPLLAGRPTLEGVYLQASPNSPAIFYLQAEISRAGSAPLPGYVFPRQNLGRALEHLRLFNVSQLILVEPQTKNLARTQPGLLFEAGFGDHELYRVADSPGGYAFTPAFKPVLVLTGRPKLLAFQWFRFTDLAVPLALAGRPPEGAGDRFAAVFTDSGRPMDPILALIRRNALPRQPLSYREVRAEVEPERIQLSGLEPGQPVMVRVSYHPAWRAESGETIFRASPAFLLVYPTGSRLVLTFGPRWPHRLGLGLGLGGMVLLILGSLWPGLWDRGWLGAVAAEANTRPRSLGRRLAGASIALLAGAVLWSAHDDPSSLRDKAHRELSAGRVAEARRLLQRAIQKEPLSLVLDLAWYDLALTHFQTGDFSTAAALLQVVTEEFPDSAVRPETLYHLGLCLRELGRPAEANQLRHRLIQEFPENSWAKQAAGWTP